MSDLKSENYSWSVDLQQDQFKATDFFDKSIFFVVPLIIIKISNVTMPRLDDIFIIALIICVVVAICKKYCMWWQFRANKP